MAKLSRLPTPAGAIHGAFADVVLAADGAQVPPIELGADQRVSFFIANFFIEEVRFSINS